MKNTFLIMLLSMVLALFNNCTQSFQAIEDVDLASEASPGLQGQDYANGNKVDPHFNCDPGTSSVKEMRRLSGYEVKNIAVDLLGESIKDNFAVMIAMIQLPDDDNGMAYQSRTTDESIIEALFGLSEALSSLIADNSALQSQVAGSCLTASSITSTCLNTFIRNFGRQVWRRPLTNSEVDMFESAITDYVANKNDIIDMVVVGLFNSPNFYVLSDLAGSESSAGVMELTSFEVASKMSLTFWGSTPDEELLQRAEDGTILNAGVRLQQAERMVADEKAKRHLNRFFDKYLPHESPEFNDPDNPLPSEFIDGVDVSVLADQIKDEYMSYMNAITWDLEGGFEDIMTSRISFVKNPQMADILGLDQPENESGMVVNGDPRRVGLLGRPFFVARSGRVNTSPIFRGLAVNEDVLCQSPPSAANADPNRVITLPDLGPMATTREVVHAGTSVVGCRECHAGINPYGFALESFDGFGRFRESEKLFDEMEMVAEVPVDTRDEVFIPRQGMVTFNSSVDLQHEIVNSGAGHQCFVKKWFEFNEHQKPGSEDNCHMNAMISGLSPKDGSKGSIKKMMIETVVGQDFLTRKYE